ncbi:MAG: hypothetical protein ABR99_10155 [Rhodobacter sp. BACL10 MAG-121220-bin24]|jgi:Xaa-Pro dipeptidase|nr:MAG: hypothetical protein ABR99_10155 [Rhodobacter sp. BACL10 MAG-121220-bin24]HCB53933.1 aminopeptidase P family protein [Rhodobacter sp.]
MANLNRFRAQYLMEREGIEALLILSPEGFLHATGADAGVGTMWRQAGAVAVLIPADPTIPEAAIVSDLFVSSFKETSHITDIRSIPLWVETATITSLDATDVAKAISDSWLLEGRTTGFHRPTTFDPTECWRQIRIALRDRNIECGKVGVELSAISARDYEGLISSLLPTHLSDATELAASLRMVKSENEISLLRQALNLSEVGIRTVRDTLAPGISRDELSALWLSTIQAQKGQLPLTGVWDFISVGTNPWGSNTVAQHSDIVKMDVGCVVRGYSSDCARTFVIGQPTKSQKHIYDGLLAGFNAGMAILGPGVALSEVHKVTNDTIQKSGLDFFHRGHFGHSLGLGPGTEEWPFISADSPVLAEDGMVLAFECPFYINGLGGFIIENQLLITKDGVENMNKLSIELYSA